LRRVDVRTYIYVNVLRDAMAVETVAALQAVLPHLRAEGLRFAVL
jgi:hypothetical protein